MSDEIKTTLIAIGAFLWSIYYPALRKAWAAVWAEGDPFWWKMRMSLFAVFTSLWPCLLEVWKGYGNVIVAIVIKLIKARLGIPTAYRKAKLVCYR